MTAVLAAPAAPLSAQERQLVRQAAVTDTVRGFGAPMAQFPAAPSSRRLWFPRLIPWIVTTPLVGSDTGARVSTRTVYPLAS